MANSPYHKLPNGWYINIAEQGGPSIWRVQFNETDNNWYAQFSYDGVNYNIFPTPFSTSGAAQSALDNVISQINSGTFGP